MSTKRYPPKRICQSCGGEFYAWQENGVCLRCRRAGRADARELADMVREQRYLRREAMIADGLDVQPVVHPNQESLLDADGFPKGF